MSTLNAMQVLATALEAKHNTEFKNLGKLLGVKVNSVSDAEVKCHVEPMVYSNLNSVFTAGSLGSPTGTTEPATQTVNVPGVVTTVPNITVMDGTQYVWVSPGWSGQGSAGGSAGDWYPNGYLYVNPIINPPLYPQPSIYPPLQPITTIPNTAPPMTLEQMQKMLEEFQKLHGDKQVTIGDDELKAAAKEYLKREPTQEEMDDLRRQIWERAINDEDREL